MSQTGAFICFGAWDCPRPSSSVPDWIWQLCEDRGDTAATERCEDAMHQCVRDKKSETVRVTPGVLLWMLQTHWPWKGREQEDECDVLLNSQDVFVLFYTAMRDVNMKRVACDNKPIELASCSLLHNHVIKVRLCRNRAKQKPYWGYEQGGGIDKRRIIRYSWFNTQFKVYIGSLENRTDTWAQAEAFQIRPTQPLPLC